MKKVIATVLKAMLSIVPLAGVAHASVPAETSMSDWDRAQLEDTNIAYSRFIVANPESPFVEQARRRIEALAGTDEGAYLDEMKKVADAIGLSDSDRRQLNVSFGSFMNV